MKLLEKNAPAAYASLKIVRSFLVLIMARNIFKNGYGSLLRSRRPNADTLTATAVAASVLSGRPESSLTLLTLSNGAEMLTCYAAERARRQISGLLNLNQRYVCRLRRSKPETKSRRIPGKKSASTGESLRERRRSTSPPSPANRIRR